MRKEKLLQNLYPKLRNTAADFRDFRYGFHKFQQKDYIETLQTMEIMLLKALREDFGHEL